jgi:mono/diheme cytochrome c family protein
MRKAWTLAFALGIGVGLASPRPVPATPIDPEILQQIGPQVINPGRSKKDLVETGRKLFFEETFDGNGRTCGTCHPASNNFTIDPDFIATLPRDDPLFVAEFNPDLAQLENPRLMRRFGLILENLDGFEQPGVMRGVPHNLGMPMSMKSALDDIEQATGWSGDGSPDGTLRMFTVGAIFQHLPKTLGREPGVDFRLPTALELEAMEAFMLSVGRQKDVNLDSMRFADPAAERGRALFLGQGINRACHACHANAGAMNLFTGFNDNFDTGTRLISLAGPPDGGFDRQPRRGIAGFGDGTMNTPSLIEAADTPPFFHNNAATTLEDAIAFYASDEFAQSPGGEDFGGRFQFGEGDVEDLGALLRTLNALENIRYSNLISDQAQRTVPPAAAMARIAEVVADTEDAFEVLADRSLCPAAVGLLREALALEQEAEETVQKKRRNALLRDAAALKREASAAMLGDADACAP